MCFIAVLTVQPVRNVKVECVQWNFLFEFLVVVKFLQFFAKKKNSFSILMENLQENGFRREMS